MELELRENMYIRTKDGIIDKVIIDYNGHCASPNCNCKHISCAKDYYDEDKVAKASYNIVNLIKSKDIILGRDGKIYQCWKIYKDYVFTYSKNKQGETITLVDYQIDKVLTKEQFEQMAYKVGE